MENLKAEQLLAAQRMQDYIADNLQNDITLKKLAAAAGYSPYHAARVFKQAFGLSAFEYIRALRLSKAAISLRDERAKVLNVALDYVFDSHEGFTRAFSRQFGISPMRYRQKHPPIRLFTPYRVSDRHQNLERGDQEMKNESAKTIFVQVVERPRRKLMLRRGVNATEYFGYCEEIGCDDWGMLCSVKEALYEPAGFWLPQNMIKPGTSKYVQGVELPLDYANEVPEGYEVVELAPCLMMVFQGEPYDDSDYAQAVVAVSEKIESFDPALYGYRWADDEAPRFQLEPQGYRGYIEARPVQKA